MNPSSTAERSTHYPAVPGPIARDDFLAAQRRHRRAAQTLSAFAAIAVVLVSVPLAAIIFPLLFGIAALLSMIASLATGGASVVDRLMATGGHFAEGENAVLEAIMLGLIIVLPGALFLLAIWARSLRVLASVEPAQLVEIHGARLARAADFEEKQLSNVVEELAIASAIPPPTVRIVDSEAVNAAALASRESGALILVTRGLLDHCDRSETQALLASSVAMIANGDARAAFRWMGAAAAFNVAADLLHGPLAAEARVRLRTLLPLLLSGTLVDSRESASGDGARAVDLLLGPAPSIPEDPTRGRVKIALVFPFLMASAMFNLVGFLANFIFLSPALGLLMRRRRYLADATAVQLTRDPESLAHGLSRTVNRTASGDWPLARFSPLFLVAPMNIGSRDPPLGQSFGTHPSVAARHRRVVRMTLLPQGPKSSIRATFAGISGFRGWLAASLTLFAGVLMVVCVPLMLYLMIMVTMLSLMVGMMWVMIVLLPLRWLLS
jgi:Zn-dependent protease with chaperone function